MQNIEIKHVEQISILKINREKQLNSLNQGVINDLVAALSDEKKNKNIKCVIITGSGEKAFVAKIVPEASPPPPTGVII